VPLALGHDRPGRDARWMERDRKAKARWRDRLARLLRRDRIDACLLFAWADGVEAARRAGVPALVEWADGPGLVGRIRDKSALSRIICESQAARAIIRAQRGLFGCKPGRLVVIRNGIDLERFDPERYDRSRCRAALGLKPEDFALGCVARLSPEKNLAQLVRGLAMAREYREPGRKGRLKLFLAGPDRGSRREIVAAARALGVRGDVHLLGARDDVPQVLRALDSFALVSLYEGAPHALCEAMAMGLPVIASAVGGIPEMIDGNGLLVGVNHPFDLARAVLELEAEPRLRRRLGERSRRLAGRYDIRRMIGEFEGVLLEAWREDPLGH
jgi:glycosyltransferase involved in cell wall biosynthesis